MTAASSSCTGTSCSAARNMSMKVPLVVQTTRIMMTDIATLGPDSQSHHDKPNGPWPASAAGGCCGSTRPEPLSSRWISPRGSLNHCGPWMPKKPSSELKAPALAKMKMNTTLMATELVTEGKKKAVRKNDFPLSSREFTTSARASAKTVCTGTTIAT